MIHEKSPPPTILLIMGSTRAGRLCPAIATWVADIGRAYASFTLELVDLADWPLPPDDEPGIPQLGQYSQPHTWAWSRKVAGAAGFVFVTPQYNWGYPAVLKNAIDHLYAEWTGKPALIVSYGGHGGGKCAAQLRQVMEGLKMHPVPAMPGLVLTRAMMGGAPMDPARDFHAHLDDIRQGFAELTLVIDGRLP